MASLGSSVVTWWLCWARACQPLAVNVRTALSPQLPHKAASAFGWQTQRPKRLSCGISSIGFGETDLPCQDRVRVVVNPNDGRRKITETQIITAKFTKASNQSKQTFLLMYTGCLPLMWGMRIQHWMWGRQGIYSSGGGHLVGKIDRVIGTEQTSWNRDDCKVGIIR